MDNGDLRKSMKQQNLLSLHHHMLLVAPPICVLSFFGNMLQALRFCSQECVLRPGSIYSRYRQNNPKNPNNMRKVGPVFEVPRPLKTPIIFALDKSPKTLNDFVR